MQEKNHNSHKVWNPLLHQYKKKHQCERRNQKKK